MAALASTSGVVVPRSSTPAAGAPSYLCGTWFSAIVPLLCVPPVAPTSGGFDIASCTCASVAAACSGVRMIGGT